MGTQLPMKGARPQVFGPCLLWPNGWMDEDSSWYGSRPQRRPHCVRRGPSSAPAKGAQHRPPFSAHVYCGHGRPSQLLLSSCSKKKLENAYLRQGMSYQCRHLANQYERVPVNHYPYFPIVTNPNNSPCIQRAIHAARL